MFAIARFELRQRLWRVSSLLYFLLFFGLGMLMVLAAAGAITGATVSFGGGRVLANAPYALHQYLSYIAYFGVVVIAAVMGRAVQEDFEYDVHPFFFTAPISKAQYLFGRFLGAFAVLLVLFTGIAFGAALATKLPMVQEYRIGPNHLRAYL